MFSMKQILKYIVCLLSLSSCRQELCTYNSLNDSSNTLFSIDWSQSALDESQINNVSIYAYPSAGTDPYLKISGNINSGSLSLPAGEYSLLIFNDFADDLSSVNLLDLDSYDLASAEAIERSSADDLYYDLEQGEVLFWEPEPLAVWRMEEFEVSEDDVSCPYCGELQREEVVIDLSPTPLTTQCVFTVRVENLSNAQIIQAVVKGFASGASLATEERISPSEETTLYSINFTEATYDELSSTDGQVEAEITTFGQAPYDDQSYSMEFDIILSSGTRVSFTRDITDQVVAQDNSKIVVLVTDDDNKIVLPEGVGTGFGVESWGDRESIELL